MRLCLTPNTFSAGIYNTVAKPASADADLAAYFAGLESYFSNVAISFTDTTFSLGTGPTSYTGKATTVTDTTTYNLWLPDVDSASPYTWHNVPFTNSRLTFGGLWFTSPSTPVATPRKCAPAWWWQLDADVGGFQCVLLTYAVNATGSVLGTGGVIPGSLNADGICNPFIFRTTTTFPQCQYADVGPASDSYNAAAQVKDSAGIKYPFGTLSGPLVKAPTTCIVQHSTSPITLASCP